MPLSQAPAKAVVAGESLLAPTTPADPTTSFPRVLAIPPGTEGDHLHSPPPPEVRFGESGTKVEPAPSDHGGTQLNSEYVRAKLGLRFSSASQ